MRDLSHIQTEDLEKLGALMNMYAAFISMQLPEEARQVHKQIRIALDLPERTGKTLTLPDH